MSKVAVIGNVKKHHNLADGKGVRFVKTELTSKIEAVDGRNFSGFKVSMSDTQTIAGALMSDMVNGFIVDSDGFSSFKCVGNDLIEQCYTHVQIANSNSSVVACTEYKRQ